jgi:hypothetical protein
VIRIPPSLPPTGARHLLLIWAGISIGVAFLATPAKFLAPSLALPVALDVGRHTFAVYNRVELVLAFVALLFAIGSRQPRIWRFVLIIPVGAVLTQTLWLLPALDARAEKIMAGDAGVPPSAAHPVYVGLEILKILILIGLGAVPPTRPHRRFERR